MDAEKAQQFPSQCCCPSIPADSLHASIIQFNLTYDGLDTSLARNNLITHTHSRATRVFQKHPNKALCWCLFMWLCVSRYVYVYV